MLPNLFGLSSEHRQKLSLTHELIPFLHNLIFQYTNPLPFETEAHTINTIPLAREHSDSHLRYFYCKTPEKTPFQNIFNPVHGINTGIFYITIHPQNLTLSIQDVFLTYVTKLIQYNEN